MPDVELPIVEPEPLPRRSALSTGALFRILLISVALVVIILVALWLTIGRKDSNNQANQSSDEVAPSLFLNAKEVPALVDDSDGDGLTDEAERVAGTDAGSADTDRDGLYDFEEVNVYQTDPLVNDTDRDGYADGVEVGQRFNPNGPGPLLDFEATRAALTNAP